MRRSSSFRQACGAAVLVAGTLTAGSAWAGADDGGSKAFWNNPNPGLTATEPQPSFNVPSNARATYQGSADEAVTPSHRTPRHRR